MQTRVLLQDSAVQTSETYLEGWLGQFRLNSLSIECLSASCVRKSENSNKNFLFEIFVKYFLIIYNFEYRS